MQQLIVIDDVRKIRQNRCDVELEYEVHNDVFHLFQEYWNYRYKNVSLYPPFFSRVY